MDAIGETFICKHERTDLCERADIYELQYSGLTHARLPADFSSRHFNDVVLVENVFVV